MLVHAVCLYAYMCMMSHGACTVQHGDQFTLQSTLLYEMYS